MADEFSFDAVSKVDFNLIEESINVAMKEVANRYDFKDSNSNIELDVKANELKLSSSDDYRIKALYDVLLTRFSKRNVPLRNFAPQKIESGLSGSAKQVVKIQQGISADKAREIVKAVKDSKLKVTCSIQGDRIRVVSRSKDQLQAAITLLRGHDFGQEIQFENYR